MQPTAHNKIILGGEEKNRKDDTSPHHATEDVRGVLSSTQVLIHQYLLDAMLIFFLSLPPA